MKSERVTMQAKATEQYFLGVLIFMLYNVALIFYCVDVLIYV